MSYDYKNNFDREQYERWMRHGRERGWLERGADEMRSFFGDEEAQRRRMMDERYENMSERERTGSTYGAGFDHYGRGRYNQERLMQDRYMSDRFGQDRFGQDRFGQDRFNRERFIQDRFNQNAGQFGAQSGEWPWSGNADQEYRTFGRTGVDSMRGRGSKSFKRTDERIAEEIHEVLAYHHDIDASEIQIDVKDGEVTIRGTVENRFEKRTAEDLVEDVFGVKHVQNLLRVEATHKSFGRGGNFNNATAGNLNSNLTTGGLNRTVDSEEKNLTGNRR